MRPRNISVLILYDSDGKILLQHRALDARSLPGYWAFFGGGIEESETSEQALVREIHEELAYDVQQPLLLLEQKFAYNGTENIKYVFVERYEEKQKLQLGEGQGLGWYFPGETKNLLMVDHDQALIERLHEHIQQNL